jgi:hypothetical protein
MPRDEPEVIAARMRRTPIARNIYLDDGPPELKAPVLVGTVITLWRGGKEVGRSTLKTGAAIAGDTINLHWRSSDRVLSVKVVP